jgi:hypothetical protein
MLRRIRSVLVLVSLLLLATPGVTPTRTQEDPLSASTKTVNVELILDASGSMAEALPDGETRVAANPTEMRSRVQGFGFIVDDAGQLSLCPLDFVGVDDEPNMKSTSQGRAATAFLTLQPVVEEEPV